MKIQLENKEDPKKKYTLFNCAFVTDWHYLPNYGRPEDQTVLCAAVVGIDETDNTVKSLQLDFWHAKLIDNK